MSAVLFYFMLLGSPPIKGKRGVETLGSRSNALLKEGQKRISVISSNSLTNKIN